MLSLGPPESQEFPLQGGGLILRCLSWAFRKGRIKRDLLGRGSLTKGIPISVAEKMIRYHPFLC